MILRPPQNLVHHREHNVWWADPAIQDSHLWHSRDLVEITWSDIIITEVSIQLQYVLNSILPQPDNPCKCLALLIQYPDLLFDYRITRYKIYPCPTHCGCSYEHRGIWQILEYELHICALIIAHFSIHVENTQMVCKKLHEPPSQMTDFTKQRTNYHWLWMRRCTTLATLIAFRFMEKYLFTFFIFISFGILHCRTVIQC